jgi:Tol biopolymer transport system component
VDSAPSLSPDGGRFVYVRYTPDLKDRRSEIHVANNDGDHDLLIYTSLHEAQAPVWSPHGNQIAWIEAGGPAAVVKVLDVDSKNTVSVVQPSGAIFRPYSNGGGYSNLAWLPDGNHLLILYYKPGSDRGQIGVLGLSGGDFHTVTNDVSDYGEIAVSADGKMVATVLTNVDSSLAYYKGDGGTMTSSTPLRVSPVSLAWADEDRLFLLSPDTGISKLDRTTGTLQPIDTGELELGRYISTCPDGQVLFNAVPKGGGESSLFRMYGDGSGEAQLTTVGTAVAPFCAPDSQKVYFTIREKGPEYTLSFWSVLMPGGARQKEFDLRAFDSLTISRDAKFAGAVVFGPQRPSFLFEIRNLTTHQVVHRLPLDMSSPLKGGYPIFSPDGKAIVVGVTSKGGNGLRYQPIDGSPAHLLIGPLPDTLTAFAWSPSGSKLGVLQLRKSSDVVLITDLTGKQPH